MQWPYWMRLAESITYLDVAVWWWWWWWWWIAAIPEKCQMLSAHCGWFTKLIFSQNLSFKYIRLTRYIRWLGSSPFLFVFQKASASPYALINEISTQSLFDGRRIFPKEKEDLPKWLKQWRYPVRQMKSILCIRERYWFITDSFSLLSPSLPCLSLLFYTFFSPVGLFM